MVDDELRILDWLVHTVGRARDAAETHDTLTAWWQSIRAETADWRVPVDRAIARGALADRVAFAFAAGYQAALARLVPAIPEERVVSLCVTEAKGNHPRALETTLVRAAAGTLRLNGRKSWATHSPHATELLVAARAGLAADGRPAIKLVRVRGDAPGVTVEPMHGIAFVPEISHGAVTLDEVAVADDDVLPGDGYADYVKPFRTVEDVHVAAALGAHLTRLAFVFDWPRDLREDLLAHLVALRGLALADPRAIATHLALGGVFRDQGRLLVAIDPCWARVDDATRARWERDRALLAVAGSAREKRLEAAWTRLSAPDG
ncbi:MAG: acyl-CoA dehydrogenase family protein [bacterium]